MIDPRIGVLELFCAKLFPDKEAVEVKNWRRHQGGWESEIFAFDLCSSTGKEQECLPMALRQYSGNGAAWKAAHEFKGMRRLFEAGYPVPRVYASVGDRSPLRQPFLLMEFVEGKVLWGLMESAKGAELHRLTELFNSLFVGLHRLDWKLFIDENDRPAIERISKDPYFFIDNWLEEARRSTAGSEFEGFSPVIDWLQKKRDSMACPKPSVLHQDFHPANILIRPDGQPVVIDWTSLTVSDPRFDLAWSLILADAYIGEDFRLALLEGYERQLGKQVAEIEAFEVCACARRLFDIWVSLTKGAGKRGMRPEAVEAMKRDMPATMRVYQRLVRYSEAQIPRFEDLQLK